MKALRRSKRPSIIKMQNMASSLKEKTGRESSIEIQTPTWYISPRFGLYVASPDSHPENSISENFDSWEGLQDRYFELMEADYE